MLAHSGLSKMYWAEAVNTAAFLRNRVPTTAFRTHETPYSRWYGKKPNVSFLRVFGCAAYSHVPDNERKGKFDKKTVKLRFIGYSENRKGYRLLDENSHRVVIRYDVKFNEDDFSRSCSSAADEQETTKKQLFHLESDISESVGDVDSHEQDQTQPVRQQPLRDRRAPVRFGYDEHADLANQQPRHFSYCAAEIVEPSSIDEALQSEYAKEWKSAADIEYASLIENDTWELVELPKGRSAIGCKWIFKVKHDSEGQVERFKGRLVAKGYSQKYKIDYDETFSPVVRFSSIRTLLAYAVQRGMIIHQMDVVTAFLNGELNEEIYMQQPPGYIQSGKERLVCKLKKSLYGLKQSPRCWNATFREYLNSVGFKESSADPCVFIRKGKYLSIIAVYVDDLILITETPDEMYNIKSALASRFKMKDMGQLHYCLGVNIVVEGSKIKLSQKQYIQMLLMKYRMIDANPVSTPIDQNVKLVKDDGHSKPVNSVHYQSMVGSLLYAAMATRPDIAHAVSVVSKFSASPTTAHMTAVKRILVYLKGTLNLSLQYSAGDIQSKLTGYSDADFANDETRHSTTGNVFIMSNGAISWLSKKQTTVALSTTEAEYVALSSAAQEAVCLRSLLNDLHVDISKPTLIYEDNQSAIAVAMSQNTVQKRRKHIDVRHHFIQEAIQNGTICVQYCPTDYMVADILTKPLTRGQFETLRTKLGLV